MGGKTRKNVEEGRYGQQEGYKLWRVFCERVMRQIRIILMRVVIPEENSVRAD